jgi:phosphatidate cytidylyltransferase
MPSGNITVGTAATAPAKATLRTRIVSAVVLAPVVLGAAILGAPYWDILVALMGVLMAWEWARLCGGRPGWLLLGVFYVSLPCLALLWIRSLPGGLETLLWILALVWATDTAAYVAGRGIGGPRLAPRISPNKTWAGLAGGIVGAALIGFAAAVLLRHASVVVGPRGGVWSVVALSGALAVVEQAGDLVESAVKRHFGVKDSSNLIPGHGGVLDRVDGLLAVSLAVAGLSALSGRSILFAA